MKIDNHDIYQQIGNLFYSIAIGQKIKPIEEAELKMLISKDWIPRDYEKKRSIISDETHIILITMDANKGSKLSGDEAFQEFERFFRLNAGYFTYALRKRMLDTAIEISSVFKSDNPDANVHLLALKELLDTANVAEF